MIPVYQLISGPSGDCYSACLASILEINIEQIPDYSSQDWARKLTNWLENHDYTVFFRKGDNQPLNKQLIVPSEWTIVGLETITGDIHSVVCFDGAIRHDPSSRPWAKESDPVVLWTIIRKKHVLTTRIG